jgi:hypothetical protein
MVILTLKQSSTDILLSKFKDVLNHFVENEWLYKPEKLAKIQIYFFVMFSLFNPNKWSG